MERKTTAGLLLLAFAAFFLLAAGCTGQSAASETVTTSPVTTAPVSATAAVTPYKTVTHSATPGPVQTVPDYEAISVTVDRNTITENPIITTTFNGGFGLGMTERMEVTVIRSDGKTETGYCDSSGIGSSVTLMGTTGNDRVIVDVTMSDGIQYTIIDQYYPFPGGDLA
ncbi:MAG: hypothetical protein WC342_06660 [Methanoregula sp.]|jgi:hypothetical protein